ncbi:MAG: ATP-binding protein [Bacteroidales bacterium]|jgi:hypothetical protein
MEAPFIFGKIAQGANFTDREEETKHLDTNFSAGINTILISPRRWGKSSLVQKASEITMKKDKKIKFCFIDLFNVRSEEQFYNLLAEEIIKSASPKWAVRVENTKKFITRFIPKITYSPSPDNNFSLGLDWREVKKNPDEILDLSENIAKENDFRIIICIDEFQNISTFDNPLAFQKKLRSHWQKHQHSTYCLYGSKRNMMLEVFASSSMPFYKFGDIMFLHKISEKHWISFIVKRFSDTGKEISPELAQKIIRLAEMHPYYVQQLSQLTWFRTKKKCVPIDITAAFESLALQLSLLFQNMTDNLSRSQVNFLQAVIEEVEKLSSKETLQHYKMGTSANILRIKQALYHKEIIETDEHKIIFQDPIYKYWLKKYFFVHLRN